uniref:Uncharacterized protein n=1 Tax=Schistocephalus solidus TaxID=70667 RepID=A0A0X3PIK3_SCHSO
MIIGSQQMQLSCTFHPNVPFYIRPIYYCFNVTLNKILVIECINVLNSNCIPAEIHHCTCRPFLSYCFLGSICVFKLITIEGACLYMTANDAKACHISSFCTIFDISFVGF